MLNAELGPNAEADRSGEGAVERFAGDARRAFSNAPRAQADYFLRALPSGIRIREADAQLRAPLVPDHHFSCGIWISDGPALAANFGSPGQLDYTAIGTGANPANQLQAVAKPGEILLNGEPREGTKEDMVVRPVRLEGLRHCCSWVSWLQRLRLLRLLLSRTARDA